jgi:hypothetical protein
VLGEHQTIIGTLAMQAGNHDLILLSLMAAAAAEQMKAICQLLRVVQTLVRKAAVVTTPLH